MNYPQSNHNNYPNYSSPDTSFYGQSMNVNNTSSQPQENYSYQNQNSYPIQNSNDYSSSETNNDINTPQQPNIFYNNNLGNSSELPPPLP